MMSSVKLFSCVMVVCVSRFELTFGQSDEYPHVRVCEAKDRSLTWSPNVVVNQLRNRYGNNCTHIQGNLIISNVDKLPDGKDPDLSFLSSIQEVSGFVYIAHNSVHTIPLNNLRVIRGQNPHISGNLSISLFVSKNLLNEQQGDEFSSMVVSALEYLDMRSLTVILNGDIYIADNPGLCYFPRMINWEALFVKSDEQRLKIDPSEFQSWCAYPDDPTPQPTPPTGRQLTSPSCSSACKRLGDKGPFCWGPEQDQCQKISKCKERKCQFCYYSEKNEECCHSQCVGGCTGSGAHQCHACQSYMNNRTCVNDCPKQYITQNNRILLNPDFKYNLGPICVKRCPPHFMRDKDSCVIECNLENFVPNGDVCEPCPTTGCLKTCKMTDLFPDNENNEYGSLHAGALVTLQECRYLIGILFITDESFSVLHGRPTHRPIVDVSLLWNLRNIIEVTGTVHIDLKSAPQPVNNLTFLEKLQRIRGERHPNTALSSLAVYNTQVEFLGLRSLRRVDGDPIAFFNNSRLCYTEGLDWVSIAGSMSRVQFHSRAGYIARRSKDNCEKDGKLCHSECDPSRGCWGPGPNMCMQCRGLKAGDECVSECTDRPGYYQNVTSSIDCARCHPHCRANCLGPGAHQCTGGCKVAMEKGFCLERCSRTHYLNPNNQECLPCSQACANIMTVEPVCTGPGSHPGKGGCTKCTKIVLNNESRAEVCIHGHCPDGSFISSESATGPLNLTQFAVTDILAVCRPCDVRCSRCTGPGFMKQACTSCRHFWLGDECSLDCPEGKTYKIQLHPGNWTTFEVIEENQRRCLACSDQCSKGCTGPGPDHCQHCKNLKIYLGSDKQRFVCNATCPLDHPYILQEPGTGAMLCARESPEMRQEEQRRNIIIGVTCGLSVLVTVLIIIVVSCLRNKAVNEKIREELRAAYSDIKEPDSKNTAMFSREPNLGRLEMINTDDLLFDDETRPLGVGAFGAVYKGRWRVPKHAAEKHGAPKGTLLDVAIKVIQGGGSSRTNLEELMEEAKVMASVSHRHCLRMIGLCLTHERRCLVSAYVELGSMDRYLRQHGPTLNSLVLLSWAEQIADGMAYLEARGIIHRDLATRNVLVNSRELVQITDFGLAKMLEGREESQVVVKSGRVPIRWLSIETLMNGVYSHKTDVWAYGVTLWEIFTLGKRPYESIDTVDIKDHVMKGGRLPQPDMCTLDVYMVMVKCWMEDDEARPTFIDLMQMYGNFCKNPGRYLYIQGDEYEIRRAPTGEELEMHPMLSRPDDVPGMWGPGPGASTGNVGMEQEGGYLQPTPTSPSAPISGQPSFEPLLPARTPVTPTYWRRAPGEQMGPTQPVMAGHLMAASPGLSAGNTIVSPKFRNPLMSTGSSTSSQSSPRPCTPGPTTNMTGRPPNQPPMLAPLARREDSLMSGGTLSSSPPPPPPGMHAYSQHNAGVPLLVLPECDDRRYCSDPTEQHSQLAGHPTQRPGGRDRTLGRGINVDDLPPPPPPPAVMPPPDDDCYLEPLIPHAVPTDDDYVAPSHPPPTPTRQSAPKPAVVASVINPEYFFDQYSHYYPDNVDYLQPTALRETSNNVVIAPGGTVVKPSNSSATVASAMLHHHAAV